MVGSSVGKMRNKSARHRAQRTRNDRQPTPKVVKTDLRGIQAINEDTSFRSFDESEERQRQSTLSRPCPPKDADLFSGQNLEIEVMKNVGKVRLQKSVSQVTDEERKTYCVADDQVLALNASSRRPSGRWSRFHKLCWLSLQFNVLIDTFNSNLVAAVSAFDEWERNSRTNHRLLHIDEFANHEEHVSSERRGESKGESRHRCIDARCNEACKASRANDTSRKQIEPNRHPEVNSGSSKQSVLGLKNKATTHLPTSRRRK